MNKTYDRINWENYPSDATPLNEQNLNKMDSSVDELDNRVISLDIAKFDKTEAQELFKDVSLDGKTGIITFTLYSGATRTIDTLLEKIAINFDYDAETERLIIILNDGTIKYIDLSALITEYEFLDSDTIAFSVSTEGKVSAIVKEGSIEEKHLRPDYLAEIKVEAAKAQTSATNAANSETNAKKSETAAKSSETNAATSATSASESATTATQKATEAATSAANAENSATSAYNSATTATNKAKTASESATNAANSASTATAKANAASASATDADYYAKKSQSYAVGGTGTRENEDSDNAKYYYEQAKHISQGGNGLVPMGTISFANIPTSNIVPNSMYNISDNFTSDERFLDGGGIFYGKGSNIYYTVDGKWDVLAASSVTGVKGNKESAYRQGNVNITPSNIGALPENGNAVSATKATQDGDGNNIVDTYLTKTGDTTDNIATFYEPEVKDDEYVDTMLFSGDPHNNLFNRIAVFFNNVRYLYKMLGTIDISAIGDGSVTGAIKALGYQDEYYAINGLIFTRNGKNVIVSSNGSRANVADIVATTIPQEFCPRFDTRIPIIVSSGTYNNVNGDLTIHPSGQMRVYCNNTNTYGGGSYATVYTGILLVNGSYIATDI